MSKYGPYFDLIGEIRTISPKTDKSCFFGYYDLGFVAEFREQEDKKDIKLFEKTSIF